MVGALVTLEASARLLVVVAQFEKEAEVSWFTDLMGRRRREVLFLCDFRVVRSFENYPFFIASCDFVTSCFPINN
jgi:hypothetical protein